MSYQGPSFEMCLRCSKMLIICKFYQRFPTFPRIPRILITCRLDVSKWRVLTSVLRSAKKMTLHLRRGNCADAGINCNPMGLLVVTFLRLLTGGFYLQYQLIGSDTKCFRKSVQKIFNFKTVCTYIKMSGV